MSDYDKTEDYEPELEFYGEDCDDEDETCGGWKTALLAAVVVAVVLAVLAVAL